MKTIILLIISGAIVAVIYTGNEEHKAPSFPDDPLSRSEVSEEVIHPRIIGEASPDFKAAQKDLFIIKGEVLSVTENGFLVSCHDAVPNGPMWSLPPSAGAGDSARLADLAMRYETQNYGPLMGWGAYGRFQEAEFRPTKFASDVVFIVHHPHQQKMYSGKKVQFVAADVGAIYEYPAVSGAQNHVLVYSVVYKHNFFPR